VTPSADQPLADLAWPMVPGGALLVLPVGSCEQHGPHLPVRTDALVAEEVARRLVTVLTDAGGGDAALLAPTLAYGASGEHAGFPGTLSIGTEVLRAVLVELGRSARSWAGRVLVLNGHGGNATAVSEAVGRLRYEGDDAAWLPCAVPGGDAHAGRTETSLLLALRPEVVDLEQARAGDTRPIGELLEDLRRTGVAGVSPNGVLGDPTGATAAEGRQILDGLVTRARAAVRAWAPAADGRLAVPAGTRQSRVDA
jgi:creatinine amidohydrolase